MRPLFVLDQVPDFIGDIDDYEYALEMTSLPVYSFLTNTTFDETKYWGLTVFMKDPSD